MPVSMTIRNVPDDVRDELAARAKRAGMSLQEYALARLSEAAEVPSPEDSLLRHRAALKASGGGVTVESILADLHADRR